MEGFIPVHSDGSPSAQWLTPRSKVAKMLADIDNGPTPSPIRESAESILDHSRAVQRGSATVSLEGSPNAKPPDEGADDRYDLPFPLSSDDSDDAVRRPQGRAARRMRLGRSPSGHLSSPVNRASLTQRQTKNRGYALEDEDLYFASPAKTGVTSPQTGSVEPQRGKAGNGLYFSPEKSTSSGSDPELPSHPVGSKTKLTELIAQKRAERLIKEAEERDRRQQDFSTHASSDLPDEAFDGPQDRLDPIIERIMSDAAPPTRKASKKALLEMERETQRLSRQQALAHQMKVKKKFTTNDLFAKFNFRQSARSAQHHTVRDMISSSVHGSDGPDEGAKEPVSTPPTSPPTPLDRQQELVEKGALSKLVPVREDSLVSLACLDDDEELPDMASIMMYSQRSKNNESRLDSSPARDGLKLARLGKQAAQPIHEDSDGELDILPVMPSHLRMFETAAGAARAGRPADSKAIHHLKHLSKFHSQDALQHRIGSRASVNPKVLDSELLRRAKEQARIQQLERIEELKAKGIEIQTTEQREQEAEVFENLLEKARLDAVALRRAEKAARTEPDGEGQAQASADEEDDEDYVGSGSDDTEGQDEEEEGGDGELDPIDATADEVEGDKEDGSDAESEAALSEEGHDYNGASIVGPDEVEESSMSTATPAPAIRRLRKSHIVIDEDDEAGAEPDVEDDSSAAQAERDPFAAFGFGNGGNDDTLLSLTQMFHATMRTPTQITQEDSFNTLRQIAPPSMSSLPPTLPNLDTQTRMESQQDHAGESQAAESQRISLNWETKPPETPGPASLSRTTSALMETPGWQPTQDAGLPSPWTAVARRRATFESEHEHDTQPTELLRVSESPGPSAALPKRGRLTHKRAMAEDEGDEAAAASTSTVNRDAFREMVRRQKEALTAVERADAEREMREMMDEQAEESEDEYAGLGGDDFIAAETEEDKAMIDSSHIDVDERELAAHFAERQRLRDEEETSRLYKDLTTGVLRRRMGANAFDLDEDEDELAIRRRQMRQVEEARKRKALLKDENVATLAEGRQSKGKDAFLKTIADDDNGDDDNLDLAEGGEQRAAATQDESQQMQPDSQTAQSPQEVSNNKRQLNDAHLAADDRPPAKYRRTESSAFRRPTSLLEVQQSVSFLLDEPNAAVPVAPSTLSANSDSDHEDQGHEAAYEDDDNDDEFITAEEARQNDGGFAPNPFAMEQKATIPPRLPASQRRTAAPKSSVVDRLSLKRGSSTTDSVLGRTAWAAGPATNGFKVPSLLRRATTNTSAASTNDRGVTTPTHLSRESSGVKMGGTKKSSLAYQARAEERKAIVEASAKRREQNTARIALLRRNSSALGKGLKGRFE